MATRNESHVHDLSTLANFKDWGKAIHDAFIAFGWTNSSDTGQVNWSTIASVPTSGVYLYEIFQPGDGGTAFYVKMEYGNNGGSQPAIRVQLGTGTNGSGTLSGITTIAATGSSAPFPFATSGNSGATQYNCLFSGDSGRFSCILWRDNATSNVNLAFNIERSRDNTGAVTNSYVTLMCTTGNIAGNGNATYQNTIVFGVGATPVMNQSTVWKWNTVGGQSMSGSGIATSLFNGNFAMFPVCPCIGYHDNPMIGMGNAAQFDFTEASLLTTSAFYGSTHTYLFSKIAQMAFGSGLAVIMLWE